MDLLRRRHRGERRDFQSNKRPNRRFRFAPRHRQANENEIRSKTFQGNNGIDDQQPKVPAKTQRSNVTSPRKNIFS